MRGAHMPDGTKSRPPYLAMGGPDSIMWNRQFGHERFPTLQQRFHACRDLDGTLRLLGARQLIVGHTPQVCIIFGGSFFSLHLQLICRCTLSQERKRMYRVFSDSNIVVLLPHVSGHLLVAVSMLPWLEPCAGLSTSYRCKLHNLDQHPNCLLS